MRVAVIGGTGLVGGDAVVAPDTEAARQFFATATGHLLAGEQRAGVAHHVVDVHRPRFR